MWTTPLVFLAAIVFSAALHPGNFTAAAGAADLESTWLRGEVLSDLLPVIHANKTG